MVLLLHLWQAVWQLLQSKAVPSKPVPSKAVLVPPQVSTDLTDRLGHGTFVAGALGAVGNNKYGVTGAAWKVTCGGVLSAAFARASPY